jgi:NAD(P)-dependent dehydrogenase (short-subunit alcohol dehydrogenase family)
LITGSVRRIGRAISLALAGAGYEVVVHGRGPSAEASELVALIAMQGSRGYFVPGDLAQDDAADTLVAGAVKAVGRPLTLLVNCASQFETDAFGNLDPARWDRHFAINLKTPIFLAQAFAAQAQPSVDASIVNITDQRTLKPVPRQFSYTLTKCALGAATVMLAQALAPHVRVNAVAPGPTLPSPRQDETAFAAQQAALPLEHGPGPGQVAEAVVYLAGARAVTGVTLPVDGGQHIAWQTPDASGIDE